MRVSSTLVGFAGAAAGMAAAVVSYQGSAEVDERPEHESMAVLVAGRPLPDPPPRIRTTFAECVPPARLEDGACVTEVVQEVPVPAAPQPVSAVAPPAPAPVSVPVPAAAEHETEDDEAAEEREEAAEEAAEEGEEAAEERAEKREEAAEERAEKREEAAED